MMTPLAFLPEPALRVVIAHQRRVATQKGYRFLGMLPPTANARRRQTHWIQRRETLWWRQLARACTHEMLLQNRVPLARVGCGCPLWQKATLLAIRYTARPGDTDGLAVSMKAVVDGAVKDAGLLRDDSPEYLRERCWALKCKEAEQRVELLFWEGWRDDVPPEPSEPPELPDRTEGEQEQ